MSDKSVEDLSVQELRRLLMDKRRVLRDDRLERFRRTGRVAMVPLDPQLSSGFEKPGRSGGNSRRLWVDRLLLGVEIIAVLVLIGIALNGLSVLRTLNRDVAAAMQQPTLEPTPLVSAVVLPEGHTPPNGPNGAQPNDAEIPEHLRPLVQAVINVPIPTPGSRQAVRIQVPAIGVDAPVVQGDGWEQLKLGVAQHIGTADPGQNGNVVLSGHNDVFGEVFRDLDRLKPGDTVVLFTTQRQYSYVITGTQIVAPTAVEVMNPTPNATLTLISCHPYLVDNHRIVVSAVLQSP